MNTGGPAFPLISDSPSDIFSRGLTRREWYATFAPPPTRAEISAEGDVDRIRNPHNDSYKPPRRSRLEIIADLRFRYADAMIAAADREPTS